MEKFTLTDSQEHYLSFSEQPKKFDADSPVTNVFFDDTNGQLFTIRSGGVAGVTVIGMDKTESMSFRMEDRGPIVSIKFSPDQKILAIQRNPGHQNATVEFINYKGQESINVEYTHCCKWKNANILGFVWPKVNEITYITDHGIELLQVLPEKKQLKNLKSVPFSAAWFSWCPRSKTVLLAGNNAMLLQPFALSSSTITKLQKLELDSRKPLMERDVLLLRVYNVTWCSVFFHPLSNSADSPNSTEVRLIPVTGSVSSQTTHILKTGLDGRFAVSVVDDLIIVHHQSSQTSLLFDINQETNIENDKMTHLPIIPPRSIRPASVGDMQCPMYSGNWVVFQPDYIIDARFGILWKVHFIPSGIAYSIERGSIAKIVSVLLRRCDGKEVIYKMLHQLISDAGLYLAEISKVFDEINSVYRNWAELEMARNTADVSGAGPIGATPPVVLTQEDICTHVFAHHYEDKYIVQVITAYVASLGRIGLVVGASAALALTRAGGRGANARARGAGGRALACRLLALNCKQSALDMMRSLDAYEDIIEVLLSMNDPVSAVGVAKQAGPALWNAIPARKLLAAAKTYSEEFGKPNTFVSIYHALVNRNERLRGSPNFTKGEQCDIYVDYYKKIMAET